MKNLFYLLVALVLISSCDSENKRDNKMKITIDQNWQFSEAGKADWKSATVPGTVHTDLMASGNIEDPYYRLNEKDQQWIDKKDWEYKTDFMVEDELLKKDHIEMIFMVWIPMPMFF